MSNTHDEQIARWNQQRGPRVGDWCETKDAHLAREGRMTVTIGRRELLAALGGAAAAWPLAARGRSRPVGSNRRCR